MLTVASGDVDENNCYEFWSWSSVCLCDSCADSVLGDVHESVCGEFWRWSSVCLCDSCADSALGDVCLMWIRTDMYFGVGALYVCGMLAPTVPLGMHALGG